MQQLIWHEPIVGYPDVRFEVERLGKHTEMRLQHQQKILFLSWWRTYAVTSTKTRPIGADQFLRDWLDESKLELAGRVAQVLGLQVA